MLDTHDSNGPYAMQEIIRHHLDHKLPRGWTLRERRSEVPAANEDGETTIHSEYVAQHASFAQWDAHGEKASTKIKKSALAAAASARDLHAQHEKALDLALARRGLVTTHDAFDEDAGAWVPVTPEMRRRAEQVRQAWSLTKHIQAACVREAFDQKLYLAEGYDTKREYCFYVLGIDERSARRLYSVAKTFNLSIDGLFSQATKQITDGNRTTLSAFDDAETDRTTGQIAKNEETDRTTLSGFENIGVSNLYELLRLDEDDLADLKDTKTFTDAGGRAYTLEDLGHLSARKTAQLVKEKTSRYRQRLQEEEERRQGAEAERDYYEKQLEIAEIKLSDADALRAEFTPQMGMLNEKRQRLEDARKLLGQFRDELFRLGITADDPETLCEDLTELLSKLEIIAERAGRRYQDVRARITDLLT